MQFAFMCFWVVLVSYNKRVITHLKKKSGKVREFQSGQKKVKKTLEKTVLVLPH